MKFMKLGSKPDSFQKDGDDVRYVATDLATDIVVNVGDVKFYLHKFPLLSKSARLQKLVTTTLEENGDEIYIRDIPGGPASFEICAKFCYNMTVTLNAYNVIAARCAAEYLEMYETVEKGNLIYKIEVFLNSSIFRGWKDSIIVLQTTKAFQPWCEELKVVAHCLDSIASKASTDTSKVDWSYTYNHKKLPFENGNEHHVNALRISQMVPKDWWVEDICELQVDLFKQVITAINMKGKLAGDVIGEAIKAYALRKLPGFSKGRIECGDVENNRLLIETLVSLPPSGTAEIPCSFLLQFLTAAIQLDCEKMVKCELIKRIGRHLDEAMVSDLLIRAPASETTRYDVDTVQKLVGEFIKGEQSIHTDSHFKIEEFEKTEGARYISDVSKARVAKLIDGYLAEIARDSNLPLQKFVDLACMVSGFSRPSHDGLYRAVDMYLKEHAWICKSERKRICRLMDCRRLSADASMHAMQNERLPLRVIVQVLFFEQLRTATSAGNGTPELPLSITGGSHGSSTSTTTNTEEDWDAAPTAEDLTGDLTSLRLRGGSDRNGSDATKIVPERVVKSRMTGLLSRKIFSKLLSNKDRNGELISSDTSGSPSSVYAEETKSTPSSSRRHSVSVS